MKNNSNIHRRRKAAFTLSECLIVMIVGGIIFLGVAEGLGLFIRYTSSRSDIMEYEQQVFDDWMKLNGILSRCDSIQTGDKTVKIYRNAVETIVSSGEERIVLQRNNFVDTLMQRNRAELEILGDRDDGKVLPAVRVTVETDIDGVVAIDYFPRLTPAASLVKSIEETEEGYGYEE